jgi:hypothetical protein
MTAAPGLTIADVANFTADNGTAVLRHQFTDSFVRQRVSLNNGQIAFDRVDSPGDLLQLATEARRAARASAPVHGGKR